VCVCVCVNVCESNVTTCGRHVCANVCVKVWRVCVTKCVNVTCGKSVWEGVRCGCKWWGVCVCVCVWGNVTTTVSKCVVGVVVACVQWAVSNVCVYGHVCVGQQVVCKQMYNGNKGSSVCVMQSQCSVNDRVWCMRACVWHSGVCVQR